MHNTALIILFAALPFSAHAALKTTVSCEKAGRNGQPAYANAVMVFEIDEGQAERTIYDLRAEVSVGGSKSDVDNGQGYSGQFAIARIAEDPNYRPIKYKDSSKFPNVNAKSTRGAESGMWGYLVVPHELEGEFESHYIFQAGDHLGGTVHMNCHKVPVSFFGTRCPVGQEASLSKIP